MDLSSVSCIVKCSPIGFLVFMAVQGGDIHRAAMEKLETRRFCVLEVRKGISQFRYLWGDKCLERPSKKVSIKKTEAIPKLHITGAGWEPDLPELVENHRMLLPAPEPGQRKLLLLPIEVVMMKDKGLPQAAVSISHSPIGSNARYCWILLSRCMQNNVCKWRWQLLQKPHKGWHARNYLLFWFKKNGKYEEKWGNNVLNE